MKREWVLRDVREDGSAKTFIYETREQRERHTLLNDLLADVLLFLLFVVALCVFTLGITWGLALIE